MNKLVQETSPYLLQHSNNPVEWFPWGLEALEKSRQEDKPIFLSIGYAACHWCHVMAHESFEDPDVAAIMNEHFVNIKVDREQRPDIDSIYMNAVVAMTGQGGWPLSVFLTPDGHPFFGGTYYPPTRRYNLPSFRDVLFSVHRAWINDRPQLVQSGKQMTEHLHQQLSLPASKEGLSKDQLDKAVMVLAQEYDWKHGGWGKAPKFPQPMAIEFLLRRATRGDKMAQDMAIHALQAMAKGGMYDVLGGGFARYSTDDEWKIPHFEKMLYDNAQLALVYLHAHLITGMDEFKTICVKTLEFIKRELTSPEGGFYSSLDADSEGEEGKYYIWTPADIIAALPYTRDADLFLAAYGVTDSGNFEGCNVLHRSMDDTELAARFKLTADEIAPLLDKIHSQLLGKRQLRLHPSMDDKVVTAWNALGLLVYSEAARYLDIGCLEMAMRNANFVLSQLYKEDIGLFRTWRNGEANTMAFLEDYSATILALLSLYQTDANPRWYQAALKLSDEMLAYYSDPSGGFFDTHDQHEALILKPKDIQDNATPSGNSLAAAALILLSAYTGNTGWRELAERMCSDIQGYAVRAPTALSQWLCAIDLAVNPIYDIALLGKDDRDNFADLLRIVWSTYRPNIVLASALLPLTGAEPPILAQRTLLEGRPTAFVCRDFVCNLPVNQPEDLRNQLDPVL